MLYKDYLSNKIMRCNIGQLIFASRRPWMVPHAFFRIGSKPGKLTPTPGSRTAGPGLGARPLVPVTLALMAGMAAPAWGLRLPEPWLLAGALALWAALALLWWQRRPARFLPLIFFALLGVAFYPAGPAAGFSSRAPRQTCPSTKT